MILYLDLLKSLAFVGWLNIKPVIGISQMDS